ncbi:MAG: HesA/MoeB/ThiF family protein [Candidatus Woesearchaeota archaeon]|nr:MAG: HesA/MoeB/ThiF family protein [Candidatus Woesearchaeota archaeon]
MSIFSKKKCNPRVRYEHQISLPEITASGQKQLQSARVAIIGVGGLGSIAAELLVRMGVGALDLYDDDHIVESNLQRQTLFNEEDIGQKKVSVLARELQKINSGVTITPHDVLITEDSITQVDAPFLLDCVDNVRTRLIINEYCHKHNIPWIHMATAGTTGTVFVPGEVCFNCIYALKEELGDCTKSGILPTTNHITVSHGIIELFKLIAGKEPVRTMLRINTWSHNISHLAVKRNPLCNVCKKKYDYF